MHAPSTLLSIMTSKSVSPLNADGLIEQTESDDINFNNFRFAHPLKALLSIELTLPGMLIPANPEQPSNELAGILVMLSGRVISVRFTTPLKIGGTIVMSFAIITSVIFT